MGSCKYCLCRVCNPVRCPRGRYHCMPCYHGTVLDCDFFVHKKMTRVYRIKSRSPALTQAQLLKLKTTIDLILGEDVPEGPAQTIREAIKAEEQRHNKALRDIVNNSRKN